MYSLTNNEWHKQRDGAKSIKAQDPIESVDIYVYSTQAIKCEIIIVVYGM